MVLDTKIPKKEHVILKVTLNDLEKKGPTTCKYKNSIFGYDAYYVMPFAVVASNAFIPESNLRDLLYLNSVKD